MPNLKLKTSYHVAFSPDGLSLAVIGRDVKLWDLTRRKVAWKSKPLKYPHCAVFSADSSSLLIKNSRGELALLRRQDGSLVDGFAAVADGEGAAPLYASDGKSFVDASWDGAIRGIDANSGEELWRREFPKAMSVHLLKSGELWLCAQKPRTLPGEVFAPPAYFLRWESERLQGEPTVLPMRFDNLYGCALDLEGKRLACGHYERAVKENRITVYAVETGEALWEVISPTGEFVRSMEWSADGRYLACTHSEGFALYRGEDGSLQENFVSSFAHHVAWSLTGHLLACGDGQEGFLRDIS